MLHLQSSDRSVFRIFTSDTGTSNQILFHNADNFHYGTIGTVSGNGTNTGDVFGIGYTASLSSDFTPVLSWTANTARVGIGTTSPGSTLHVAGTINVSTDSTTRGTLSWDGTNGFSLNNNDNTPLRFLTTGTERARFDATGRLLVGTSSESGNALQIVRGNTGSATGAGVIDVGLGTTRPGAAGTALGYIRFTSTSNTSSNYHYAAIYAETDGTSSSDTDMPGRLVFSTTADGASSPTERARINNTGYLTGTVNGLSQGLYACEQYYRLNADLARSDVSTAQSIFGVGVTLIASTVYEFEMVYTLSKTAGTTSHTIGVGFGGTATLNNIFYELVGVAAAAAFPSISTPDVFNVVQTATNTTMTAASALATRNFRAIVKGTVSVNAGGTFIPQFTLSAAPGGAYSTLAGSYVKIAPLGASGANTSIGSWA